MGQSDKNKELAKKRLYHSLLVGSILIGLAVLFYFDALFPWVIALIGILLIGEELIRYYS